MSILVTEKLKPFLRKNYGQLSIKNKINKASLVGPRIDQLLCKFTMDEVYQDTGRCISRSWEMFLSSARRQHLINTNCQLQRKGTK